MRPPPRKRQRTAKALNSVSEISSNSADSLSNSLLQRNTSEQPIVVPHIPVIDYQLLAQEILKQQGNVNNTRTAPSSETVTVPLSKSYTTAHTSTDMNPAINNSSLSSAPSSQIREHNATISLNSDEFQLSQPMMITTTDSIANRQHGQNVVHSIIDNIFNASDVTATTIDQGRHLCHGPIIDLSGGIPLGAHVSQKVREQIWNNDMIDLSSLLPSQSMEDSVYFTVAPNILTVQSKPPVKSKFPLSFYKWNEAFRIYMAIYIEKHKSEAAHMLKYMSIIQDLYEMKGAQAFRTYDQSFRLLRRNNPLPWQKPVEELVTKAINLKRPFLVQNHSKHNYPYVPFKQDKPISPNNDRDGTCHQYNAYQSCNRQNCTFRHICKNCKGPHPRVNCTRSQPNGSISTQSNVSNNTSNPNKK